MTAEAPSSYLLLSESDPSFLWPWKMTEGLAVLVGGSGGGGGGGSGASRLKGGLGGGGGKGGSPTRIQVEGQQRYGASGGRGGNGGIGASADGVSEIVRGGSGYPGYPGEVIVVPLTALSLGKKINISVGSGGDGGRGAPGLLPGDDGGIGKSGFVLLVPLPAAD